jgi:hypothetical protein
MAASPGFAPSPSVSETDALLITPQGKMVAREGSAPSTSGCRPDVILFHHRAETIAEFLKFEIYNLQFEMEWLPGMDSHHHARLQRAMSC